MHALQVLLHNIIREGQQLSRFLIYLLSLRFVARKNRSPVPDGIRDVAPTTILKLLSDRVHVFSAPKQTPEQREFDSRVRLVVYRRAIICGFDFCHWEPAPLRCRNGNATLGKEAPQSSVLFLEARTLRLSGFKLCSFSILVIHG